MEQKASSTLSGKNALVVGGTSSIGGEVSKLLVQNGMNVTCTGRKEPVFCCNKFIHADFSSADFSVLDSSDFKNALSTCDVLAVCYGPFVQKEIHNTTDADWKNMALLNYALPGILASRAIPGMMERHFGRIVLFGGTGTEGIHAYLTNAAYAGAKTGISVLVKSIAKSYAEFNITCNAILPGFTRNAPSGARELSSLDVARQAVHLLLDDTLSGALLNVDSGWAR